MTTMAAVKVPATACSPERHRAESAWSVHQRRMLCEVLFHGLEEYINNLQGDGVMSYTPSAATVRPITTAIRRSQEIYPNLRH